MSNGDNGKGAYLSRRNRFKPLPPGLEGGQYKPLSEASIQRIHQASLEVLEHTGIDVTSSEAREILRAAGARLDEQNQRIYLPRQLVEWALSSAPRQVTLYGRDPHRPQEGKPVMDFGRILPVDVEPAVFRTARGDHQCIEIIFDLIQ